MEYFGNIEELTLANKNYRQVLHTGDNMQLVLMNLSPKEEIGMEVHENVEQFFRFERGQGSVVIENKRYQVYDGISIIVPKGASHNVLNTSEVDDLKLYTIYSPPNHPEGALHKTKAEADEYEKNRH